MGVGKVGVGRVGTGKGTGESMRTCLSKLPFTLKFLPDIEQPGFYTELALRPPRTFEKMSEFLSECFLSSGSGKVKPAPNRGILCRFRPLFPTPLSLGSLTISTGSPV